MQNCNKMKNISFGNRVSKNKKTDSKSVNKN